MSIPVTIFNAGSFSLQLLINNGAPTSLAATGGGQNWVPQPNSTVSFTGGYPEPGAFGSGRNNVQVIAGSMSINLQVSIPQVQIMSLQLYIFLSNSSVSWALLNNGQFIGSGAVEG